MHTQLLALAGVFLALAISSILGYLARQTVARRQAGTLEQKIDQRVAEAKKEAQQILAEASNKVKQFEDDTNRRIDERRKEFLKTEQLLLKRESVLDKRIFELEKKEQLFGQRTEELKKIKERFEAQKNEMDKKLEELSGLSKYEAEKQLFDRIERDYEKEIISRMKKLEQEGAERFEQKAKEIIAFAIQKYAAPTSQEMTTSLVNLPSEDVKGRIIGKEGRNIRTLERLCGVEIIVDETPEAVTISGFDPVRRHIAKTVLERLIKDGRIQPARIEELVARVESEVNSQIKEAGETAVYDAGIVGLDQKLVQLLGRLKFRTSYGQNVLLHSLEVCHIAGALASEIGANVAIAKKGGLFHDIGKALDHQVEGSHVAIGIRILERFNIEKEVINAMKSHHEDFPYESIEAVIVQAADAISGARPGARKDTVENYLRRLVELESLATSFAGVDKAWALQAGREIRVFVKPEEVTDFQMHQLAHDIANRIQEELRYPGEIKVTVIRENKAVEYAR